MDKVLMYHAIGSKTAEETGASLYCVSRDNFRRQMEYLVHGPQSTDHGQILITFDDGLLDNYTVAYPILKELGLKAYFFILVSRVGTKGYINWDQARE